MHRQPLCVVDDGRCQGSFEHGVGLPLHIVCHSLGAAFESRYTFRKKLLQPFSVFLCAKNPAIMELLFLTANIIAVVDAAASTADSFRKILSLNGVPQEVFQFMNEVSCSGLLFSISISQYIT